MAGDAKDSLDLLAKVKAAAEARGLSLGTKAVGVKDSLDLLAKVKATAVARAPSLVTKATDLDALRTSVVDAAGVSTGLWVSYLFAFFYLLVAAGAVTHEDLFYQSPVKLPFLNIDLPLKGFFILGPGLFLIVHTYILLHFSLLASKVQAFNKALWSQITEATIRSDLRRQLPANIFVQALAGPSNERNGVIGLFLWLIALISMVIGPVVLLWFFELQFLPYHDSGISNWHRIAVGIDLVLMWLFWWRIALRDGTPPDRTRWWDWFFSLYLRAVTVIAMVGLTGFSAALLVGVATFPGEPIEAWYGRQADVPLPLRASIKELRRVLIEGDVNPATRAPESPWSNRLVLPGLNVVVHLKLDSDAKLDFLPETVSLRNRNLDDAVLTDAVLRKVDLTGALLLRAHLDQADLRKAKLECGLWAEPEQREKAGLASKPICAQLQGASLFGAQLQGASLVGAQLQGASLNFAQLQGASLNFAQLQGASLNFAQLQGASLFGAQLQGASLVGAQLQGASLNFAQLQGASLDRAQLQGASLRSVFVWRADSRTANTANTWIEPVAVYRSQPCIDPKVCLWTADSFKQLTDLLTKTIPEGQAREAALKRIDPILNPEPPPYPNEDAIAARWNKANTPHPTQNEQEVEIAGQWKNTGCDAESAPHVVAALAKRMNSRGNVFNANSPFAPKSPHAAQLAADFLHPSCAGTKGLSDADTAILIKIRDESAPPLTARPDPPNSAPTNAQGTTSK